MVIMPVKTYSDDILFYSTKSPKPKDGQFAIIYDKARHQILTFEKLKAKFDTITLLSKKFEKF